jgi:hypothetical protein
MDHDKLFTLRIKTSKGIVSINAFEAPPFDAKGNRTGGPHGHTRIDVEIKLNGKPVFKRGDTYCGVPRGVCVDSFEAKELVMSLAAMKPGDTDDEYFQHYTPEQLEFAEALGEEIDMTKHDRYCDPETGELKDSLRNR